MSREEGVAPRPEPGKLDPVWTYLFHNYGNECNFRLWQGDGSDSLYFVDPRRDPQPYELREGGLDLGLGKEEMTELRDLFTYLLANWGRPEMRESHPEPE